MKQPAENTARPIVAVTGASRGIGHAMVKRFHDLGWEVITLARTPFTNICPWAEGIVKHVEVDLAEEASIRHAIERLNELIDGRGLKALINNAGISPKTENGERLGAIETPVSTMMQVQMVNLVAPLMLTRGLIEPLRQVQGAVVNVTSIAGSRIHPFAGAAYAVSKAALSALTRELAYEYDHTGVRVNAVAPGEIATSILSPGTEDLVAQQVPMKRLGTPEEVAEVVTFLCESASSYVNGAEIHINGGQHV
ncbi:MAG: SDR family oxidoreductase [Rhizobiaceae bacterium]|nr:SDR family oxidoreductase [Rhizobiaceae bacterium]